MNQNVMKAGDAVSGSLAECFFTIDGKRRLLMRLIDFEAKWSVNIAEIPILGKVGKGHKAAGGSGEWSGTAHFNQSELRDMLLQYKNTGRMLYFDIQVTNEDPTSTVGRQTVILRDCLLESGVLAKFDADAEYLDEELSGTFEDWDMPERFTPLAGSE